MAASPVIPISLSPHVCIHASEDVVSLLSLSSLPPLPELLQSFAPLPQVTTRTTSLTSVLHSSFGLRFSDLHYIETACKEDEEQRAGRVIDWISSRIAKSCRNWVDEIEKAGLTDLMDQRTPWWDEVRRCLDGDNLPSHGEGWNHPVSIIYAVSTNAPNPLQTLSALYASQPDFPNWVDGTHLKYILILHHASSEFSDDEARALFTAVKKDYGLHTDLLSLKLPASSPTSVLIPARLPRLPPPPNVYGSAVVDSSWHAESSDQPSTLIMAQDDIQRTAQFVRDFVVMSLIPWMEKCVLEWSEIHSATRRLPSRLFSSTRRLFGTSAPPTASSTVAYPKLSSALDSPTSPSGYNTAPHQQAPSQQRRLAEFATILGDSKLAISIWEFLRKEGRGGADILPLLSAPSSAVLSYAAQAISDMTIHVAEPSAHAQCRAITYAVRWEGAIPSADFLSPLLEGDRWMAWAAGLSEEVPSALLLAEAASLSARRGAVRRAAMWYHSAATRLEKSGIKPLTMHLLRKCHQCIRLNPSKRLSLLFPDAECRIDLESKGFDSVVPGVEHSLGRLLYTTGDVDSAVRSFLGLLCGSKLPSWGDENHDSIDKTFLDDFRVASEHLRSIHPEGLHSISSRQPFKLCTSSAVRLHMDEYASESSSSSWSELERSWKSFWRLHGQDELAHTGRALVGVPFYVDVVLRNPLDADITVSQFTVVLEDKNEQTNSTSLPPYDAEVIEDVFLSPLETRTVSVEVNPLRHSCLTVKEASYNFMSLLPCSEQLARRGRRLHSTRAHMLNVIYGPDITTDIEVEDGEQHLVAGGMYGPYVHFLQGERRRVDIWLRNTGSRCIKELWLVTGDGFHVAVHRQADPLDSQDSFPAVISTSNMISSIEPQRLAMDQTFGRSSLAPGDEVVLPLRIQPLSDEGRDLKILFVYRSDDGYRLSSTRLSLFCRIKSVMSMHAIAEPVAPPPSQHSFIVNVDIENMDDTAGIQITDMVSLSPAWTLSIAAGGFQVLSLAPRQTARFSLPFEPWPNCIEDVHEMQQYVRRQLKCVINGLPVQEQYPPPLKLVCRHVTDAKYNIIGEDILRPLIEGRRRVVVNQTLPSLFPSVPPESLPRVFPLFEPSAVELLVFWESPLPQGQRRSGHIHISGIHLGAEHGVLDSLVEEAENATAKRSMYAETERERTSLLCAIKGSQWNRETDPLHVEVTSADRLVHNFSYGPITVDIDFTMRNSSTTNSIRFHINLDALASINSTEPSPLQFTGCLTHSGVLQPTKMTTVHARARLTCPGTYVVDGWQVTCEVQPREMDIGGVLSTPRRYIQSMTNGRSCTVVVDVDTPK